MSLKVYNTLTRKKEIFKPLDKQSKDVGIYSCGPTVYNYAHIGNLRTYIFVDILKKSMKFLGYNIKHVMNITDVDDKTIKASKKEKVPLEKLTRKYEKIFFDDLKNLNISKADYILRASENIPAMINLIEKLMKKGYAYKTSDGIYFSVGKFKDYGKLARLGKVKKSFSRIREDEYDKKKIQDFALWKFYTKEDGKVFWNTKIGKGRPGWHIECSAMAMKILGNTIDIHTGAVDLIFPHHTNEIAQSEAATGKKFVDYWIHAGFLTVKEGKMAKSLGNVLYLKNLKENGFSPIDYRYLVLTKHYRQPLSFTWKNLESAQNSYQRLKNIISELKDDKKMNKEYLQKFKESIENDLNMSKTLQILWKLVRDKKAQGKLKTIKKMDEVFSLDLLKKEEIKISEKIKKLIKQREQLRKQKNWKKADELRKKINKLGYSIDDTEKGPVVKKL